MNRSILMASMVAAASASAHGSFTFIQGIDEWNAVVGPSTTLNFVFDEGQVLSDQYASLGVTFPDAEEVAQPLSGFDQDGWGCVGAIGGDADIHLKFAEAQYAIGAWFPGKLFAKLYWRGELIYSSNSLHTFPLFYAFGGIVSTQPFDEVVFWNTSFIFIDDIKFASTVPAPGAAVVLFGGLVVGGGRRRRSVTGS